MRTCPPTGLPAPPHPPPPAPVAWGGGRIPGEGCDLHRFFFFSFSPFFPPFPFPVLCFAFRFRSESEASSPRLQGCPPAAFPAAVGGGGWRRSRTAAQFARPGPAAPRGLREPRGEPAFPQRAPALLESGKGAGEGWGWDGGEAIELFLLLF